MLNSKLSHVFVYVLFLTTGAVAGYTLSKFGQNDTNTSDLNNAYRDGAGFESAYKDDSNSSTDKPIQATTNTTDFKPADSSEFEQYKHHYQLADKMSTAQLEVKLTALSRIDDKHERVGISRIYFSKYISLQERDVIQFYLSLYDSEDLTDRLIFTIYHEWLLIAPENAMDSIYRLQNETLQTRVIMNLLSDPAFDQTNLADQLASMLPADQQQQAELVKARKLEGEAAFNYFLTLKGNNNLRRQGIHRALYKWARKDPMAALSRVNQSFKGGKKLEYQLTIVRIWAESEPERALALALELESGDRRFVSTVLSQVARDDGNKAMKMYEQNKDKLRPESVMNVLASWADQDLTAAVDYWQNNLAMANAENSYGIMHQYLEQKPIEALDWAQQQNLPNSVLSGMLNRFVNDDQLEAEAYLNSLTRGEPKELLVEELARSKARENVSDAREWVAQYSDYSNFDRINQELTRQLISQDPAKAASEILINDASSNNMSYLISHWQRVDADATKQWVQSIPQGDAKDKALMSLAQTTARNDMDEAIALAESISNEQIRDQVINQLANIGKSRNHIRYNN